MMRLLSVLLLLAGSAEAVERVKVSVFSLFRPQRLTVKPVAGSVLRIEAGKREFLVEGGRNAALRREGDTVDCFVQRQLVSAASVRAAGNSGNSVDFLLGIPGRIERRYRGTLEVVSRAGVLEAMVSVELETAVASVVAAESSSNALPEALKAQAVVSRSYYLASRGRHTGFDFCDTTHCQFLKGPVVDSSSFSRAADETAGLVLSYESNCVPALHSASCGGRTKSLADIGAEAPNYPFFSVPCDPCRRAASEWKVRLSGEEAKRLRQQPHSEALRLEIVRRRGWGALPGNQYELEEEGDVLVLHGRGSGHGVGLCQQGAAIMAANGAGFREILSHYFPATSITPHSARLE